MRSGRGTSTRMAMSRLRRGCEVLAMRRLAMRRLAMGRLAIRRTAVGLSVVAIMACGRGTSRDSTPRPARFDFGQTATSQEIQAWDIDVRADGRGLPDDSG